MSMIKRHMEHLEEQRQVATKIAIDAGVISPCEYHSDVILDNLGDRTDAYKLGNYLFTQGKLEGTFSSRKEMTDAIEAAVEDSGMDCGYCTKD